jgi:hypothetical protein
MDPNEKPSSKPSIDSQEWLEWLGQHVLFPLEGAFAPQLKGGVLSQSQIALLSEMLHPWPRPDILATMRFILIDCPRFPTPFDWERLRPHQEDPPMPPVKESIPETFERLAKGATGWPKFVLETTVWGLKTRRMIPGGYLPGGHPSMPEAYDKIIAEGRRRGIPEAEIAAFQQAKIKTLEVRAGCMKHYAAHRAKLRHGGDSHATP